MRKPEALLVHPKIYFVPFAAGVVVVDVVAEDSFSFRFARFGGDSRAFLICIQQNYKLGWQECDGDGLKGL